MLCASKAPTAVIEGKKSYISFPSWWFLACVQTSAGECAGKPGTDPFGCIGCSTLNLYLQNSFT